MLSGLTRLLCTSIVFCCNRNDRGLLMSCVVELLKASLNPGFPNHDLQRLTPERRKDTLGLPFQAYNTNCLAPYVWATNLRFL